MIELYFYGGLSLFGLLLFIWERIKPAVHLPKTDNWLPRFFFNFGATLVFGKLGEVSWMHWIETHAALNLFTFQSPIMQGLTTFVVGSFALYWWHRWRHENFLFWNLFHQMHHSPQRVETFTAFYTHPIEGVVTSLINGWIIFGLLSGTYEGFLWSITIFSGVGIFYHANIRTPRGLDYFVNTPELHRIHHKQNVHYGNFSDLPVWDIIFGTFRSRDSSQPSFKMGFRDNLENHFWEILAFKNVLTNYPSRKH